MLIMEKYHFFLVLTLFSLSFVRLGCSVTSIPEIYWRVNLPNTPMPQFIKHQLFASAGPPCGKGSFSSTNRRYLSDNKQEVDSTDPNCIRGLESTNAYDGLLSYGKKGLESTNAYGGLLSYSQKGLESTNAYGGLLSYGKKGLESTNAYGGLLSYGKKGLESTNSYDGLLSYGKKGLASTNGYDGLLSYGTKGLASTNGYDGLLSYGEKGLASTNGYDGLLSYGKKGLASPNGYDGLLSYGKKGLASTNGYDGLLSYGKKGLASTNGYDGLLSYAKKGLASTNGYDGLLSYTKKESTHDAHEHVFYVEKDLHLGTKLSLHFQKSTFTGLFIPRDVSNKIPFSSDKVQETLRILSIDPKSHEAYVLSQRIALCEEPTIEGVEKKCVTSLESMIDYVTSMIGTNVEALTTHVDKNYSKTEYTIEGLKKLAKNDHETVVCHKMGYPYAVYFCHRTTTIRSYMANLIGVDGTKIEAIVACHKETNDFLDNYAKNVLKIIPGSTHICHFPAAEDTIMWVRK